MKTTDRAILISLIAAGLLAGFYFMVLSPKREEAAKLGDDVEKLQSAVSEQQQTAAFAEEARKDFPKYYGRMVVLGKAVPEGADSASLLVQLNSISADAGTTFHGLRLAQGAAAAAVAPAPAPVPPPAEGTAPEAGTEAAPETTPEAATAPATATTGASPAGVAPATETAAASLPIGSTVGPAGLPTLPYDLDFRGNFFQVADFVSGLDDLINLNEDSGQVAVDGRLMTVDGFALAGGAPGSSPELDATFLMTTYVTPSSQGLTLGASPTGPAAVGETPVTPAASVTP
jgi:Tfp pilus assembly protein PilO